MWLDGEGKAKGNEGCQPRARCRRKGALNPGGRWAEGGHSSDNGGGDTRSLHPLTPQAEARPLPEALGPAGRICREPTSKEPRKLKQAPEEAAQLWGWGKPHNYGGVSSHAAPLHLSFPSQASNHLSGGAELSNSSAQASSPQKPGLKS